MSWDNKGHHTRTYAIVVDELGNKEMAQGYGDNYAEGEPVECWYNEEFDYYQMQHKDGK